MRFVATFRSDNPLLCFTHRIARDGARGMRAHDKMAAFAALLFALRQLGPSARNTLACAALPVVAWWARGRLYPWAHGPVEYVNRNGGELVAEVFAAHGVRFVYTLVGGHISPLLVASQKKGIRVIDVRHEVNAVFAADATARLTGVPGVAAVTAGPGLTNTVTAVKNAQMAQSPLVLLGGAAATVLKGRGALQDIDQMALMRPLCKFTATCDAVRDIVPTLRRAFQAAAEGVPGPVFVELPIDVLYPISEVSANMGLSARKRARDIDPRDDAMLARLQVPKDQLDACGGDKRAFLSTLRPAQPVFLRREKRPARRDSAAEHFFRSERAALTARILIPAQCSAVS